MEGSTTPKYQELKAKILEGDIDGVVASTKKLLDAGESPLSIINDGLIGGIDEVGECFKKVVDVHAG